MPTSSADDEGATFFYIECTLIDRKTINRYFIALIVALIVAPTILNRVNSSLPLVPLLRF